MRTARRGLGATGIQHQLRAAKQSDCLARGFAFHLGVPNLRGAAAMHQARLASDAAFKRGAEIVGLELDRREIRRAFRQRYNAAVTASGIGKRDHGRRVQIAVGRQMLLADLEPAVGEAVGVARCSG